MSQDTFSKSYNDSLECATEDTTGSQRGSQHGCSPGWIIRNRCHVGQLSLPQPWCHHVCKQVKICPFQGYRRIEKEDKSEATQCGRYEASMWHVRNMTNDDASLHVWISRKGDFLARITHFQRHHFCLVHAECVTGRLWETKGTPARTGHWRAHPAVSSPPTSLQTNYEAPAKGSEQKSPETYQAPHEYQEWNMKTLKTLCWHINMPFG